MTEVPDGSIDLVVTGPPYWAYVDYKAYLAGVPHLWRSQEPYEQFLERLGGWFREVHRTLRPGRYCVVNLGTIRYRGRCYPLPFHAVGVLERAGFTFCFEIVWHKVAGGRQQARVAVRTPYPGAYTANNRTEYLLVFRKEPCVPFLAGTARVTVRDAFPIDTLFTTEIANNVWHILPAAGGRDRIHPCPFPPEIPYRVIRLLSLRGETVLDPFMGIGTTACAAKALGRHYVGYEVEESFVRVARENLTKPWRLRKAIRWEYH
jgi:modification methylase